MNKEEIIRMAREAGLPYMYQTGEVANLGLVERFAALVAAAERERVMQIVQSMKADLEAKFENVYMEGAMAGAAAEREACAKVCDVTPPYPFRPSIEAAHAIRARSNP